MNFIFAFFVLTVASFNANAAILMSGSSTVYPFATVLAEEFSYKTNIQTPIVEAVGTGGGFSAFCNGNGVNSPDVVNASRPIKKSEQVQCMKNKVAYTPVIIGLDAIIIAMHSNNKRLELIQSLTDEEIFKAFAREVVIDGKIVKNPYEKWNQINPSLPDTEIIIYGPPSTSGTRDSLTQISLVQYCSKIPEFKAKYKEKLEQGCSLIRNDGKFIESGENDTFVVHKISLRKGAIGIFGYSHYMENKTKLHAVKVNNINPSNYTISTGQYKIARPLFLYFKNQSLQNNDDLKKFLKEVKSSDAIGFGGYLESYHLIPLDKQFLASHKLNEIDGNLTSLNDV